MRVINLPPIFTRLVKGKRLYAFVHNDLVCCV